MRSAGIFPKSCSIRTSTFRYSAMATVMMYVFRQHFRNAAIASARTIREMIPITIPGVIPLNGKKKPVTLVAIVAERKSLFQKSKGFPFRNPKMTISPAPIPTRLKATWHKVNIDRTLPFI